MSKLTIVLSVFSIFLTMLACSGQSSPADEQTPVTSQDGAPPTAMGGVEMLTGTVVETMDAASYTYVLVDVGDEEIWAATSRFEVAVGDRITVPLEAPMANFHSDTLDRDFELIYFASRIMAEGEAPAAAAAMVADHPPTSGGTPQVASEVAEGEIEPVEGGRTVASVWAEAETLAGTQVTVRGRVVKFNAAILGTNWLHLQDGSGDAANGTHDITVTSQATAAVGDVVTAIGTVAVDQDFGAGYVYPAMVKDATLE